MMTHELGTVPVVPAPALDHLHHVAPVNSLGILTILSAMNAVGALVRSMGRAIGSVLIAPHDEGGRPTPGTHTLHPRHGPTDIVRDTGRGRRLQTLNR